MEVMESFLKKAKGRRCFPPPPAPCPPPPRHFPSSGDGNGPVREFTALLNGLNGATRRLRRTLTKVKAQLWNVALTKM